MQGFAPIAFQSSLGTGAILFGVFGFLYTIYISLVADKLHHPPVAAKLRVFCRIIAGISVFNALLTFYSVTQMALSSQSDMVLGIGLFLVIAATTVISAWMAWTSM